MRNKLTHTCTSPTETTRIEMITLLQEWLADSIDLMMQARQAHSKVKDQRFNALHVLFDKIYTNARECIALIAGWLVQFDGTAQSCPLDVASGKKHVVEQAGAIAFYVELMRKADANSTRLRDADTLTQVTREDDMNLWFVEVHEASEN